MTAWLSHFVIFLNRLAIFVDVLIVCPVFFY